METKEEYDSIIENTWSGFKLSLSGLKGQSKAKVPWCQMFGLL